MTWNCAQCDTVNESVSIACAVCGQARPGRPAVDAPPGGRGAAPTGEWGAPLAAAATAAPTGAETRWCQACGSALAPGLRFCGQCGADQFPPASAPVAAGPVPRSPLPPPDDRYPPRGGVGRTIAAVLGVIFVAVVAGVGAFLIASKSNTAAPPSASNDPSSGAVNAGSSSTSSSSSSTSSTPAPSSTTTPPVASTTAGGPPSSVGPGTNPLAPPGATATELAALDLAQQLATALATKDAAALAKLEPGKTPGGYEDLRASTAILKSATPVSGNVYTLRLGLVAHEKTTDEHSRVYCVTWTVDLDAGQVLETGKGSTASEVLPGWVDPTTMVDYVRTSC